MTIGTSERIYEAEKANYPHVNLDIEIERKKLLNGSQSDCTLDEASGNSPQVSPGMGSTPPRDGSHEPEREDSGDNFMGLCSSLYWKQTKEDFEEAWHNNETQVLFCFL
ncbi:hypothetical protein TKK_0006374 [Trichogramma kaykai]|uniref:Uncharacterized protein n=1 Tax=Trichogramma kaykai TaxID=54128 RepID=A0ABD2XEL9_9HYME